VETVISVVVFGLGTGAIYSLVALGIALVYKATNILNFAQGEVGTVAAFAALLILAGGIDKEASGGTSKLLMATVVALLIGALLGVLINLLVVRHLASATPVTSLVATAGVTLLFSQIEVIVFEAKVRRFPRYVEGGFLVPGTDLTVSWHTIVILAVLTGVALALAAFFRTPYGTALLATAQDPFAAELQGVPVAAMRTIAWGAAGTLAAAGGMLGAGVFANLQPGLMTSTFLIPSFTAAVLGGITSLVGAIVGGLGVGLTVAIANQLNRSFDLGLPGPPQLATMIVLLVVLVVRPQGLFGNRA
jgi:branched-chain amino acid transport system permease protein